MLIAALIAASTWVAPVPGPVTRPFDPPPTPYAAGHRGVDLLATAGSPVASAGPGTVSFAGQVAGIGTVTVTHADGLRTTYEPVAATVRVGESVASGEQIGVLSSWGAHCAACLHWGAIRGGTYVDPMSLLSTGRRRAVLLPFLTAPGRDRSDPGPALVVGAAAFALRPAERGGRLSAIARAARRRPWCASGRRGSR